MEFVKVSDFFNTVTVNSHVTSVKEESREIDLTNMSDSDLRFIVKELYHVVDQLQLQYKMLDSRLRCHRI